uniref:C2H2-type domain-containing protein n=1 Tax=Steinernema glaseri TaxID=37863 RepID=A0A1I8AQG1_9BILA
MAANANGDVIREEVEKAASEEQSSSVAAATEDQVAKKENGGGDAVAKDKKARRQSTGARKDVKEKDQAPRDKVRNNSARNHRKSTTSTKEKDGKSDGVSDGDATKTEKDKVRKRTSTSGRQKRQTKGSTTSCNSNGEGLECSDYELDEPFSDTDDDSLTPRGPVKPSLNIPRGRIRTLSGTVPAVGFSPKWGGPTMCLSCLQFFDLPEMIEEFNEHLLHEHHIVVSEMELIVDPKRYVEHWRKRFAKESVDKVFPKVVPNEEDPYHGRTDYYFFMSEKLEEDNQLRQRLAMRRLEEALACQQREREDTTFQMQCLFCRYTARGNRSKIIHHIYMIHHLNLGSPDNLVFVHEYIDHLKEKLTRNECIYCEKTFADRSTMMDHMRKRNHREVNPKNNYYDKFYIINYLELGKRWLDVLAEDFEETLPTFEESDEEEEENSWHEWQEDNIDEGTTRVLCLFCDESYDEATELLDHLKQGHKFDLLQVIADEKMDVYGRMKFLNYVRTNMYNGVCFVCGKADLGGLAGLRKHLAENDHLCSAVERSLWDKEESLIPSFGNDHFLWMLESLMQGKELGPNALEAAEEATKNGPSLEIGDLFKTLVEDSEKNTVQGVVAEDLPELNNPVLDDEALLKSLR